MVHPRAFDRLGRIPLGSTHTAITGKTNKNIWSFGSLKKSYSLVVRLSEEVDGLVGPEVDGRVEKLKSHGNIEKTYKYIFFWFQYLHILNKILNPAL